MNKSSIQNTGDGQAAVSGPLTFSGTPDLLKQGAKLIQQANGRLAIDLAGVTRVDSAAVALLLEWRKLALAGNVELVYDDVPEDLLAIARISDVEQMLEDPSPPAFAGAGSNPLPRGARG